MNAELALRKGLRSTPKYVPTWYAYDKYGSEFFNIMLKDSSYYYMYSSEISVLKEHVKVRFFILFQPQCCRFAKLRAFGVLPIVPMACQCRPKFRQWLPLVPMVCQCLPMATNGFYHLQPILQTT